jgi:hypothetical protein
MSARHPTIQESTMPKGQQRGNKEAKKPKQARAPAPVPAASAMATQSAPTQKPAARWPKK